MISTDTSKHSIVQVVGAGRLPAAMASWQRVCQLWLCLFVTPALGSYQVTASGSSRYANGIAASSEYVGGLALISRAGDGVVLPILPQGGLTNYWGQWGPLAATDQTGFLDDGIGGRAQWIAIERASDDVNKQLHAVSVFVRNDLKQYRKLTFPFEVWLGSAPANGVASLGYNCGPLDDMRDEYRATNQTLTKSFDETQSGQQDGAQYDSRSYCSSETGAANFYNVYDECGYRLVDPNGVHQNAFSVACHDQTSYNWIYVLARAPQNIASPHCDVLLGGGYDPVGGRCRLLSLIEIFPHYVHTVNAIQMVQVFPLEVSCENNVQHPYVCSYPAGAIDFSGANIGTAYTSAPRAGWISVSSSFVVSGVRTVHSNPALLYMPLHFCTLCTLCVLTLTRMQLSAQTHKLCISAHAHSVCFLSRLAFAQFCRDLASTASG